MSTLVRPMNFQQEHADVSESLGRRLREEAEVNAALSQVSWPMQRWLKRVCFPMQFEFTSCLPLILRLRLSMLRRCNFWPKGQRTRCNSDAKVAIKAAQTFTDTTGRVGQVQAAI